jgi:hypothetical protein
MPLKFLQGWKKQKMFMKTRKRAWSSDSFLKLLCLVHNPRCNLEDKAAQSIKEQIALESGMIRANPFSICDPGQCWDE